MQPKPVAPTHPFDLNPTQTKPIPMCLGCRLEQILANNNIDLSTMECRSFLAHSWGSAQVEWLRQWINGEVAWIPYQPFLYLLELLSLPKPEEETLKQLHHQVFYNRSRHLARCTRHKPTP